LNHVIVIPISCYHGNGILSVNSSNYNMSVFKGHYRLKFMDDLLSVIFPDKFQAIKSSITSAVSEM